MFKKREKVLIPPTSGQLGEIVGALIGEMNFSKTDADGVIGKMGAFRKDAHKFFSKYRQSAVMCDADLARWSENYFKLFNQRPDLSQVRIPEKPEGVGPVRLIVVTKEIVEWTKSRPLQGTQDALKAHFRCWQYANDLDEAIPTNDRDPKNGSYAVWVEDTQESGECYANKSADDLKAEGHVGPTLLECQLHEFDYFVETGKHLDMKNVRLATGSRHSDGRVPYAYWDGKFLVYWYYSTYRSSYLRSRRVWA